MSRPPVRCVLLDIEGTLYANGVPIPGAADALAALRAAGIPVRFLTNIDSRPAESIARELAAIGLTVPAAELFTPVTAVAVLTSITPGIRWYPLVSRTLGMELTGLVEAPPYTHVLVGDCRDILDYPVLDGAFRALRGGAELVALQRGRYFIRPDGDHLDTGAIVAALEYSAGVVARVLGKPATEFFTLAASSAGLDVRDCAVVGDDATTDIAGGKAAGAWTVQVRTGKYADQAAEGRSGAADDVIDSIADLPNLFGLPVR